MKNLLLAAVLSVALIGTQGCGEETLSKEEAQQVFGAAQAASAEAQGNVWAGIGQAPASADSIDVNGYTFDWTDDSFSFTGEVTSPQGGSATVAGTGSWNTTDQTAAFDFSMIFNGYVSQGISLDGELAMSFEGGQQYFKITYAGAVDASGKVEGNATFALTVEFSEDGSVTYAGTVGGQKLGGSVNLNDYDIPSY
jgi:hypothetical protein